MKIIGMLIVGLLLQGCATGKKSENSCVVSEGSNEAEVSEGRGFVGAGCITGKFGCKWKESRFEGEEIHMDGELAPFHGKVGTFGGEKLVLQADNLLGKAISKAASTPSVNWGKESVTLTQNVLGAKKTTDFKFSPACGKREVALGVAVLYYSK